MPADKSPAARAPKRARWYLTTIQTCPPCGRERVWKEAQYSEPPPKEKRYRHKEVYDYCVES